MLQNKTGKSFTAIGLANYDKIDKDFPKFASRMSQGCLKIIWRLSGGCPEEPKDLCSGGFDQNRKLQCNVQSEAAHSSTQPKNMKKLSR